MFNLSKKIDYGLELMIFLAKNRNGLVSLREISKKRKLPFKYLEQVAIPLREAGLIEAKEGRAGGYFLAKNPGKISVAEIVEILEGPVKVGACFGCPQAAMCGQKDVWSEVGDKVRQTIEGKTLKDLIK
ncbi:transcriptional regulator [Candidatus Shapirobacteria bacterium CG10_big_fil_rev_8_21_14_0_10_38_14]|uniref:Transcriptional regulator n=1 Tax=Candidatus Shapirobacteria bacterium CG10_big_fil_rev_8_21_14_0_10_38_14 TaxID=1974483 RepID=A0A2M8L4T0_9BACT|nr:MAG: transcriptional regulator [Candidatus Shapirobacteria bacterium CG10_big_fil_rev_8_21_14_0_10_38_14]